MRQIIRLPKVQMGIVLFFLLLLVASLIRIPTALYLLVTCIGFSVIFDLVFGYVRRRKLFVPYAAIVTGLILTLIIDPSAVWYQILVICLVAIGVKNFLRVSGRHIFNPAASGLFVGWLLFTLNPSWWGATLYGGNLILNVLIYVVLAAAAYVSSYRLRRFTVVGVYLLVYAALSLVFGSSVSSVFQTIITPGVLFFSLVMLTEPMTTPVVRNRQILYGICVALLTFVGVYATSTLGLENVPDFSITALLIGNLLFFKFR